MPALIPRPHLFAITALLLGSLATAAQADPAAAPGLPSGAITQAFFGLLLVLGLIAGAAYLMRRLPTNRHLAQGAMKVVGGLAIGPRERVVLLEVGDTWVVIGIAPGQIRTLHTLAKGEAEPVNPQESPAFSQWLRHFVEQRKNNDPA